MPTYTVMVTSEIEFSGGAARGTGMPFPGGSITAYGGAGVEVQIHTITYANPQSTAKVCQFARLQTLNAIQRNAQKYNWASQGLRVRVIDCTITGVV